MSETSVFSSREIIELPLDKIKTSPYQPRQQFDKNGLEELASSIRQYGLLQPVNVRLINGLNYELVAGERRLRASKLAGLSTIPAIVLDITDQESSILAMIENLQRKDLNFLEEAEGFYNLMNDYSFTQELLAEKVGKSQSTIANKLRLLRLSKQIKNMLFENDLTERHARALLRLPSEELQLEVVAKIISDELNVKMTEQLIDNLLRKVEKKKNTTKRANTRHYIRDFRLFTNSIKQAVDLMKKTGMETDYILNEQEDGCEIVIKVKYDKQRA